MSTSLRKNRSKNNHILSNIYVKKLNYSLWFNERLHKRIAVLSIQNKNFSSTRNNLLLRKLKLENEKNSLKNVNVQLTLMHHTIIKKCSVLEQNLETCVPALVTLSKCIPFMMESVHEISKLNLFGEISIKEIKEQQTKFVKPVVHGMVIGQPPVRINVLNSAPVEIPFSDQSPILSRRSSHKYSSLAGKVELEFCTKPSYEPHSESNLEPYVRFKDVAALLKNSNAVTIKKPKRQLDQNYGKGPSRLNIQENQSLNKFDTNCSITESTKNYSVILDDLTMSNANERSTPIKEETSNEAQDDSPMSNLSSNNYANNTSYENEVNQYESMTQKSKKFKNITTQERYMTRSSVSFNSESFSSQMSRSRKKQINYREAKLNTKLRRDK